MNTGLELSLGSLLLAVSWSLCVTRAIGSQILDPDVSTSYARLIWETRREFSFVLSLPFHPSDTRLRSGTIRRP